MKGGDAPVALSAVTLKTFGISWSQKDMLCLLPFLSSIEQKEKSGDLSERETRAEMVSGNEVSVS